MAGRASASDDVVRAWTRLNRAQRLLFEHIETDLKQAGFPSLDAYDALLELSRAQDGRLRQTDLRAAMLFRQYSVSRLVDRLERDGLVRRDTHASDGRAHWIVITETGEALRKAMWPIYSDALARHLGANLPDAVARVLADTLERLYGRQG